MASDQQSDLFCATVFDAGRDFASKVGVALELIMMDWSDIVRYSGEVGFQPRFRLLLSTNEFTGPRFQPFAGNRENKSSSKEIRSGMPASTSMRCPRVGGQPFGFLDPQILGFWIPSAPASFSSTT